MVCKIIQHKFTVNVIHTAEKYIGCGHEEHFVTPILLGLNGLGAGGSLHGL